MSGVPHFLNLPDVPPSAFLKMAHAEALYVTHGMSIISNTIINCK